MFFLNALRSGGHPALLLTLSLSLYSPYSILCIYYMFVQLPVRAITRPLFFFRVLISVLIIITYDYYYYYYNLSLLLLLLLLLLSAIIHAHVLDAAERRPSDSWPIDRKTFITRRVVNTSYPIVNTTTEYLQYTSAKKR